MRISIIAALSENRVIGLKNRLPWKLPADLARFKRLTLGHHLVMGRKTFESIGRPLPGRTTIVLSRAADYDPPAGVLLSRSIDEALSLASPDPEVFIAGGGRVYAQSMTRADRLYLTRIHRSFRGDAYFPEMDEQDWELTCSEEHAPDPRNPYPYTFLVYDRRHSAPSQNGNGPSAQAG